MRTVEAYGRFLSRNGSKDDALKIYQDFDKVLPDHPLITEEMKAVSNGDKLPPLVEFAASRRAPRRFTASAPRSGAAAAKIWR